MNRNPDMNEVSEWLAWWRERTLGAMISFRDWQSKNVEKSNKRLNDKVICMKF